MGLLRFITISFFCILIIGLSFESALALTSDDHYVRTANYFLKAGRDIYPQIYDTLSSYDVLILPMEAAVYNKDFFEYARKKNPSIIFLAYVPTRSINIRDIDDGAGIRKKLQSGIHYDWYLKDPSGSIVPAWPSTLPLNVTSQWSTYLPEFVRDTVMKAGLWDGILYDEVDAGISFLNNGYIDADGNGQKDDPSQLDESWRSGMAQLLLKTRELLDDKALIVINGSSHEAYRPYINGRMFESFPTPWEGNGEWKDSMQSYTELQSAVQHPPLFIINGNTGNTGKNDIYQKVRFGLTSTLLGSGYFGFDFGTQDHGQLWAYDEYGIRLGKPSTAPYRANNLSSLNMKPDIWRRDFQQGTVLVNSSQQRSSIDLDGDFEKIRGIQDPTTNDGSIVSSISLAPSDGIILLRPLSTITGATYFNGSFVRVFDHKGSINRNGFFAYDSAIRGSVAIYQPSNQGNVSLITAEHGVIKIIRKSSPVLQLKPFGDNWRGDLNIAIDATQADNPRIYISKEYPIETKAKKNSKKNDPSAIVAYDMNGAKILSFYPLGRNYFGSLRIALGDLNADASKELVVATGVGTTPIVRIFDTHGRLLSGGFNAYQPTFRGGVFVSIADFDKSGYGKILTSPGQGGSPMIRIFDGKARLLHPGFMAFSTTNKGGVRVLASDVDGDGVDEILATTTKVFTYAVK